jgi:hypothetical protein
VPLVDIDISINGSVLPDDVVAFLREADLRVSQFVRNSPIRVTGFVPSDFVTVYHSLRAITEANLAPGTSLCEWGSGFGVVASLAAMLEFKACGIEIERGLVDASRKLADDFGLPVEFASFPRAPKPMSRKPMPTPAPSISGSSPMRMMPTTNWDLTPMILT